MIGSWRLALVRDSMQGSYYNRMVMVVRNKVVVGTEIGSWLVRLASGPELGMITRQLFDPHVSYERRQARPLPGVVMVGARTCSWV